MRTSLLRTLLGAAASAALLLAGCGGGDVSPNAGEVRLVNATSEFGSLDLYEDTDRLSEGVAPFTAGKYEDLDKGVHDFSIRGGVAGATIATLQATLKKGEPMTLVAYSNAGTPALAAIDEAEEEPDKGTAKLRFFNTAANDSGAIDAYLIAAGASCNDLGAATAVATAVSDLQETFLDINPSGAAPYRLCVTAAGDRTDVRLSTDLALGDREIITVILSRTAGAVLLNAAVMVQEGDITQAANTSARVRLAVGVDAGTVNASVNSESLGSMVAAPSVGAYRLVSAGVVPTVSWSGGAVSPVTGTTSAGGDYTLLVSNPGGGEPAKATLLVDDNARSTNTTKPVKMRLVHGATNLSAIALAVGADFIGGVAPGTASGYILTEASGSTATKVEITANGSVLCTGLATLSATPTVYSVFALGALPADPIGPCVIRADR
jgi:hypothetical protein